MFECQQQKCQLYKENNEVISIVGIQVMGKGKRLLLPKKKRQTKRETFLLGNFCEERNFLYVMKFEVWTETASERTIQIRSLCRFSEVHSLGDSWLQIQITNRKPE